MQQSEINELVDEIFDDAMYVQFIEKNIDAVLEKPSALRDKVVDQRVMDFPEFGGHDYQHLLSEIKAGQMALVELPGADYSSALLTAFAPRHVRMHKLWTRTLPSICVGIVAVSAWLSMDWRVLLYLPLLLIAYVISRKQFASVLNAIAIILAIYFAVDASWAHTSCMIALFLAISGGSLVRSNYYEGLVDSAMRSERALLCLWALGILGVRKSQS